MSIEDIFQSIMQLKRGEIADLVQAEIDANTDVAVILEQGLINAMGAVGDEFSEGRLFVPEMLRAAETMKIGLEVLRPLLMEADIAPRGTVVVGTVKGDLHDIGKNLVGMMLEGAGFTVVDLGVDVEPQAFIDAAAENQAQLVAMSALLTTTITARTPRAPSSWRKSWCPSNKAEAECPLLQSSRRAVGRRPENLPSVCGGTRIRRAHPDPVGLRYYFDGGPAHAPGGYETALEAAVRSG